VALPAAEMTRSYILTLLLLTGVVSTPARAAESAGDPAAGRQLAQRWCGNCHAFAGTRQATSTGAPSFSAVAANKAMTQAALRAFLQHPHDRMPDLHLSNSEMDDLIAFVLSPGRGNGQ
jgi:cytochrome c